MPARPAEYILRRLTEGATSSSELEQLLGQSQSTLSRLLRQLVASGQIIRIGSRRGARYALLRPVEGIGARWPLRRIDDRGQVHDLGTLHALSGGEYLMETASGEFHWSGVTPALPYYLQDQRPAGFLGRAVPRRYPELALPQRVMDWNDDHYLRYLTQRGSDTVGDLVLGDRALDEALQLMQQRPVIRVAERGSSYPRLVEQVMEGGLPGSSAHGEHPKFVTLLDGRPASQVLVKFSPSTRTRVGERWADLLIAEHHAHEVLRGEGIAAAHSRIERFADRIYLETIRFDRVERAGRLGVTSLFAIDAALYGKLDNWIDAGKRLLADRRIDAATLGQIRLLATFGALIANTDRHLGNLACFDRYDGRFTLAPVYDMLPMLYAPEHDELPARTFVAPAPTSDSLREYGRARVLAEQYWTACAADARISEDFRGIAAGNLQSLRALPRTGAFTA
ncbi:MAG TPA: type II toxin-antitoxin system HipA family toxin YjjJ [Steroidobacteraceae bacterium]